MHTVIILSKHSSNLLREYRYLFQPFVDNGAISFCDWNESGTGLFRICIHRSEERSTGEL